MRVSSVSGTLVVSLGLLGCNAENRATTPEAEQAQALDEFSVQVDEQEFTLPSALLSVHHYSDGRSEATLAFQAGEGENGVSVSVQTPASLIEARSFESPVHAAPAAGAGTTLIIGGKSANDGKLTARIADGGRLSGAIQGRATPVSFSGRYALSCFVPAVALGDKAQPAAPSPARGAAGEILIQDIEFRSEPCSRLKRRLNLK